MGARIGARDPSATPSTHRAAAFAALAASKRVTFVYHALIVVFISVARESSALSIRRSVLTHLPWLHLALVYAVAVLLCSVSLSTCQPKPPALPVVCSMLAIVFLVCRFRGLVDCCIDSLLALWPTVPQLCTLVLGQGLVSRSNIMTSAVPD